MAEQKPQVPHDQGLTLVELLVAVVLGTIVMGILATIMIGVYGTQDRVTKSSNFTSQAQVGADLFRQTLRSSTGNSLTTIGATTDQLLIVRSLDKAGPNSTSPGFSCIAFFWRSETISLGSIYWATAPNKAGIPSTSSTAGWVEIVPSVAAIPKSGLPAAVFSLDGRNVTMSFTTQPASGLKSTIRTSVLTPNIQSVVTGGCF